jgi:REP element-mobilizing transposase RayT
MLFKNKYRVESTRLKGWDYAAAGWYFVTLCTRQRECFFGEVQASGMQLSPLGVIVAEEWEKTATIRPNVELDEWVVMPNHLHGIIIIKSGAAEMPPETPVETPVETPRRGVSRLKSGSLGAIIGQFKSICTKRIWAAHSRSFGWQSRFYDHLIRDERALKNIRRYIVNNPAQWHSARHHQD